MFIKLNRLASFVLLVKLISGFPPGWLFIPAGLILTVVAVKEQRPAVDIASSLVLVAVGIVLVLIPQGVGRLLGWW